MLKNLVLLVLLFCAFCGTAFASDIEHKLAFTGDGDAKCSGAVARGDRDIWHFSAKAKHTLRFSMLSPERNVAVYVRQSGSHQMIPAIVSDGVESIEWVGELPQAGEYEVVVSGTRGNASIL